MRRLFPEPLDPVDPADVYGDPPRTGPGGRPGVRLNMIASVDGATTVAGVSGGLGGGARLPGRARPPGCPGRGRPDPQRPAGRRLVGGAAKRILDGLEIPGTTPLRLRSVCGQDRFPFLRYRPGPGR